MVGNLNKAYQLTPKGRPLSFYIIRWLDRGNPKRRAFGYFGGKEELTGLRSVRLYAFTASSTTKTFARYAYTSMKFRVSYHGNNKTLKLFSFR